MSLPSDFQVRANIKAIIEDALTTLYSSSLEPRVHGHWILSMHLGDNVAALRALEGALKGKVHGWMVGTGSISRQRPDLRDGFHTQSLQKKGPTRRDVVKSYRVWAFRQFQLGTEADNSENAFIAELEYIQDAIDKEPVLRFTDNGVRGHQSLQFSQIDTYPFGDTSVHLAQGQLDVVFHRHI